MKNTGAEITISKVLFPKLQSIKQQLVKVSCEGMLISSLITLDQCLR